MRVLTKQFLLLFLLILLVACQPSEEEPIVITVPGLGVPAVEPEPNVVILQPTTAAVATVPTDISPRPADPTAAPPPIVTILEPTPIPSTPQPLPQLYKVVDVAADDVLNVRRGPSVDFAIVGALPPTATGIEMTGPAQQVDASVWAPISAAGVQGWVNAKFLAEMPPAETFCFAPELQTILGQLQTAVATRDAALLAQITHPTGVTIGLSWWNPQVLVSAAEVTTFFTNPTVYDWGTADGSGLPLQGTIATQLLPVLDRDLVAATQTGCNTILHGPTAGLIKLPAGYSEPYTTLYRPAPPAGFEFDWGSWVVGLAQVDGRYVITYLVHFAYEI